MQPQRACLPESFWRGRYFLEPALFARQQMKAIGDDKRAATTTGGTTMRSQRRACIASGVLKLSGKNLVTREARLRAALGLMRLSG
jgi:hypothetical protein